ncbi:hypothetical protein AMJ96_CH03490 [Rhizobium sp. N113]|uniref:HNH endonuclease signature motif containing protein n=1 Tax=Rhizobium sp. N113 TaxID=1703960 RepID=UPI0007EBF9FD|nr:HNH endonuclease signature motif containing protein [Rhizobium sp. N113]ANL23164.1 hypothetical protein AMJ96_CH03490 [Rhizobium sp. N113]
MIHLPFPEDAGDQIIIEQCRKPGWATVEERWLAASASYRKYNGNPWRVLPASFSEIEQKTLYDLYDNRAQGGPISRIRRPEEPFPSCPMCGSLGGRSIDHALPRRYFPEFSIVRENLVPACDMCNSIQKGEDYRGVRPERFIHPYFDRWASQALWRVEFDSDLDVLKFKPIPLPTLPRRKQVIVGFHVTSLLGADWRDSVRRAWGPMPSVLRRRLSVPPDEQTVTTILEGWLHDAIDRYGINCWDAGLLRGLLAEPKAVCKLIERIKSLPG